MINTNRSNRGLRYLSVIVLAMALITACKDTNIQSYTTVKYQPAGGLQLDPGVFLDADSMFALGLELGDVVDVMIDDSFLQANVYPYTYDSTVMGINRFTLEKLNLKSGNHTVYISKANHPDIPVQRLEMHGESYPGDVEQWGHFVVSAPHGDCDLFTGEVVQTLTKDYGIPSSAFYYPRFTFLGRWYDANRPLGKAPTENGHWTIRERIWSPTIDSVYHSYEAIIRKTAEVEPEQALDFLCSFHGHDLKMKDAEGNRINREVIEAYGSGFTQDEYRLMIKWFSEISEQYFDTTPLLVFGNLPEHQEYEINGQTFGFWYTGLGTRTYGTLRRTNTHRGLHMETPNSLRFDPEDRGNTAKVFGEFFKKIHDELIYDLKPSMVEARNYLEKNEAIELPAAHFRYRGRELAVSAFKIAPGEVTTGEFAPFLNEKLASGEFIVVEDQRKITDTNGVLVCYLDALSPGDMLTIDAGKIYPAENREYYPITHLSWFAATAFAEFVGGRLPTEAEWVRAAGFWQDSLHTYAVVGNNYDDYVKQINFDGSDDVNAGTQYPQSLPVGFLPPNGNGLHEMSGNVWEWCSDWYNSRTFRDLNMEETHTDPQGPAEGTMRTFKGGSWTAGIEVTKTRYRVALAPGLALADLGFRVVWDD